MIPVLYTIDYIKRNGTPGFNVTHLQKSLGDHSHTTPTITTTNNNNNTDKANRSKYINVPENINCAELHNKALYVCRTQKDKTTNMAECARLLEIIQKDCFLRTFKK